MCDFTYLIRANQSLQVKNFTNTIIERAIERVLGNGQGLDTKNDD